MRSRSLSIVCLEFVFITILLQNTIKNIGKIKYEIDLNDAIVDNCISKKAIRLTKLNEAELIFGMTQDAAINYDEDSTGQLIDDLTPPTKIHISFLSLPRNGHSSPQFYAYMLKNS